jgi:hypothetical protein
VVTNVTVLEFFYNHSSLLGVPMLETVTWDPA